MENLSIDKFSEPILDYFENLGISKDNLLILGLIFLLMYEKNTDMILILVLVLLLN